MLHYIIKKMVSEIQGVFNKQTFRIVPSPIECTRESGSENTRGPRVHHCPVSWCIRAKIMQNGCKMSTDQNTEFCTHFAPALITLQNAGQESPEPGEFSHLSLLSCNSCYNQSYAQFAWWLYQLSASEGTNLSKRNGIRGVISLDLGLHVFNLHPSLQVALVEGCNNSTFYITLLSDPLTQAQYI